jgi:aminoglycoside phosphotransferase (APT) family kinase protein
VTGDTQDRSVHLDVALVRQLIADQFPQWADLGIRPVETDGHDNRTFRLGDEMSVRMPSAERYAAHVEIEQEWLPKLGAELPLPIPIPVGRGKPGREYPWAWSVNRWVPGETASIDRIVDMNEFATDLADFLTALQSIDSMRAPRPGRHNFFRGGGLSVYDPETRDCIGDLEDRVDSVAASSVWESALEARLDTPPVWIHGDVAEGNLLVEGGKLCAVIDFGQLAAGDSSCDLAIAWTLFSGPSRETFRTRLAAGAGAWARGRGWALWKALLELRAHRERSSPRAARAKRIIGDVLAG